MKRIILKNYNRILSIFLSLLGVGGTFSFTSCDGSTPGCEYGTPHATFKIYGKITSKNRVEIPNIKVKMRYDSTYTDENGAYVISASEFPTDQNFSIRFEDIDGSENGNYQPKDSIVEFKDPKFENGDGSWNSGETSKEVNIELEENK